MPDLRGHWHWAMFGFHSNDPRKIPILGSRGIRDPMTSLPPRHCRPQSAAKAADASTAWRRLGRRRCRVRPLRPPPPPLRVKRSEGMPVHCGHPLIPCPRDDLPGPPPPGAPRAEGLGDRLLAITHPNGMFIDGDEVSGTTTGGTAVPPAGSAAGLRRCADTVCWSAGGAGGRCSGNGSKGSEVRGIRFGCFCVSAVRSTVVTGPPKGGLWGRLSLAA